MLFQRTYDPSSDDAELLDRFLTRGDVEAFGRLYDRYIPLVYGVCLKYLRSADDAEDAVMAIYEELQQKVGRYAVREFRTWLYSVVRNYCLQQLRRTAREIPTENEVSFVESAAVEHLLDEGEDAVRESALQHCMEQLPEPQRRAMHHFFYDERSYADIAALTGWTHKSVKSFLQNGRRNLKLCMEKSLDR